MTTQTDGGAEAPATSETGETPASTGAEDQFDFEAAQRELLAATGVDARSRFVDTGGPLGRIHVLEAGSAEDDPPVLFVHGTSGFAAVFAPLLASMEAGRLLAFDRPGYGRSDPFQYAPGTHREVGVDATASVLDELGVETVDLVGHSYGGSVAIEFALAHPDRVRRLLLLGSVPSFPGTRPPLPIRLLLAPAIGRLVRRMQKTGEEGALDFAEVFGERESLARYPSLVRTMAAHEADPGRAAAGLGELRSVATFRGWRSGVRIREADIRALQQPTMLVWGDRDPLGTPEDVRPAVELIPDARLEPVDAGHIPFLGHPERCAELLAEHRG